MISLVVQRRLFFALTTFRAGQNLEVNMKIKSLILGSAAGLIAMSGAQAADLPVKAKAVEYVRICTLYGLVRLTSPARTPASSWVVTCVFKPHSMVRISAVRTPDNWALRTAFRTITPRVPARTCLLIRARRPNTASCAPTGIAPCFVELCEAVVAVNDVKRPSQFGQERDCWSPFRSERQAQAAMPEAACKL